MVLNNWLQEYFDSLCIKDNSLKNEFENITENASFWNHTYNEWLFLKEIKIQALQISLRWAGSVPKFSKFLWVPHF